MEWMNLTDICRPKQWKTIDMKNLKNEGYPVYGANGIIGYYDEYTHKEPTVMITCRGATCGTINKSSSKAYINGNAMALDNLKDEIVDINYLYYYLNDYNFKKVISGSAQPQITRTNLKKVKIPVPPMKIQEKIVQVLDQAQALIDKRKEQIEALDQLIESIFYTMFGDPVRNEKGWEVKKLGELGIFKNGLNYSKEDNGYSIKCLGVGDFLRLNKIENMCEIQKIDILEKPNSDYLLKDEDILFVRSNGNKKLVGRNIIVFPRDNEVTFSGFCIRFRKKTNNVNLIFLNSQIKRRTIQNRLQSKIRGANIQNLNQKILSDLDVIYPPLYLQNEFAQKVEIIEKQKKLLGESLELLEGNYQSIMAKAFKGQLFN